MNGSKKAAPQAKPHLIGQAYLELWPYFSDPGLQRVDPGLAQRWCDRVSKVVSDIDAANTSAVDKKRGRAGETQAAKLAHSVCEQMGNIITLYSNKKLAKLDLESGVEHCVAAMEEAVRNLGPQPVGKDAVDAGQKASVSEAIRAAKPQQSEGQAVSAKEFIGKFIGMVGAREWNSSRIGAKVEAVLMLLKPESLAVAESVIFGVKPDGKDRYLFSSTVGMTLHQIEVISEALKELFGETGVVNRGQLIMALDYVWQRERETGGNFWAPQPGLCWIAEMKITSALKRNLAYRDMEGRVAIRKG